MVTASRILGDQVGSTAPAFLAHPRRPRDRRPDRRHHGRGRRAGPQGKRPPHQGRPLVLPGHHRRVRHRRGLAAMRWSQDYYLLIIGAVAFTAATAGYLHRRRHRPGDTGHIAGMGIAYTAMLTAFYVDNGPHLPLWDRLPTLAFWLLPSAIAAPVITRALIRARNIPPRHQHRRPPGPDHQQIRT